MQSQRYACLTGIRDPQVKNTYKKYLESLNYRYSDTLLYQTVLLVAGSVLTQKYKIYKQFKNKIKCVSCEWLLNSHAAGQQMKYEQYEIKKLFQGASMGIYGFEEAVTQKIQLIVKQGGGTLIKMNNMNSFGEIKFGEQSNNISVLITKRQLVNRISILINGQFQKPKIPCVGIQWIETCVKTGECRYPLDYAYNYLNVKSRKRQKQITKLNIEKQKCLKKTFIQQKINSYLKENNFETKNNNDQQQQIQKEKLDLSKNQKQSSPKKRKVKIIKPKLIMPFSQKAEQPQKKIIKKQANGNKIFENCLIYFHPEIENYKTIVGQLLKPLICMKNGLYLNQITPLTTHIIVDQISQNQYHSLMKFGNNIPILRVEWLIDTIFYCQQQDNSRMYQSDYIVRSFIETVQNLREASQNFHIHNFRQNSSKICSYNSSVSISTNIFPNLSISKINSNNSISLPLAKQPVLIKKKVSFKSTIFKNISFYIPNQYRRQKQFKNLVTQIRQNGGVAYDKPKINKIMYCVLVDGSEIQQLYTEISKNYQQYLRPVSFRWVRYCVKKQIFIQFNEANYFIFKPYKFQIPIFGFLICKFQILGVDDILKIRIRELLDQLGSKKHKPSISQMTHCLLGDEYLTLTQSSKQIQKQQNKCNQQQYPNILQNKLNQITKNNAKVKFIKLKWIFDCVSFGQMLPIQEYKVQPLRN